MSAAYSNAPAGARLRQWWELLDYKRRSVSRMAGVKYRSFERIHDALVGALGRPLAGARIVEIGCGQWLANVELLAAHGAQVTGIDPELPPRSAGDYLRCARTLGVERATKSLATGLLRPPFARQLRGMGSLDRARVEPRLARGVAEALPVAAASCDAAISDNVFELLPDVEGATRELARVLRPGGVAVIVIHPITAFSGGHHPATFHHGDDASWEPRVRPWDHLHADGAPVGVFLNRLRPRDYRAIFDAHLEVIRWTVLREGARFLTADVRRALPGFDDDELTSGKIVAVARRAEAR